MSPRLLRACALVLSASCVLFAGSATAGAVTMSRTFDPVRAPQTFDVPAGVTSVEAEAVGAKGGNGGAAAGGYGARVTGTLPVTPGQRLWVMVGGNGAHAQTFTSNGWNGGGMSGATSDQYDAGDGGGASDVRGCEPGAATCEGDDPLGRLLVAGGGGGAAGHAQNPGADNTAGADAGSAAANVAVTVRGFAGGGGAGTDSAGGAAGASDGSYAPAAAGTLGGGGNGATGYDVAQHPGGGGGGGRYGGGGGGSTGWYAAGGGGGSNLVPPGGAAVTDTTGAPKISLSWEVGAPATIDRPMLAREAVYADGAATTSVTVAVRDAAGALVSGADVSFAATAPAPEIGPVTDNGDGTYSATVTAAGARGASTITATLADAGQTSAGVVLNQVVRPTVTGPAAGLPAVGTVAGRGSVTVAGTADALTESVDLHCVNRYGASPFATPGVAIPVLDGTWSVTDATLPSPILGNPYCRLVAIPSGMPTDDARTLPGPRVRQLAVSAIGAADDIRAYTATGNGLRGDALTNAFGYGCGVGLRTVDELFVTSTRWLACGADLAWARTLDGQPDLMIDGRFAATSGSAERVGLTLDGAPRLSVETSVARDGSLVLTERGEATRCTGTDAMPTTFEECGALVDTGVRVTVRTRIAPSGTHATRSIVLESTDGQPHEVRVVLATRSGYTSPELRFGDETTWTTRTAPETVAATAERYSVLLRDGVRPERPTIAVTAVPAPETQRVENGRFAQRYVRSVPAGGVAGLGMAFDLVDPADVETAAAASRDRFDVAVAIDAPATGTTTDAATATLTGTATDGAGPVDLRVGGEPVTVGDDGRWTTTVALRAGENTIEAVVQSPFGPRDDASVAVTYVPKEDPPLPATHEPPTPPTPEPPTPEPPAPLAPPTPPAHGSPGTIPAPPATRPPAAVPRLVRGLTAPKRARLARARTTGIAIPLTLATGRAHVVAELHGPWGAFAKTVRPKAGRGRLVLRLTPSRAAAAKAARALRNGRRPIALQLELTVRSRSGTTQTVTKTIRLVR